jgi:hypothetical protein
MPSSRLKVSVGVAGELWNGSGPCIGLRPVNHYCLTNSSKTIVQSRSLSRIFFPPIVGNRITEIVSSQNILHQYWIIVILLTPWGRPLGRGFSRCQMPVLQKDTSIGLCLISCSNGHLCIKSCFVYCKKVPEQQWTCYRGSDIILIKMLLPKRTNTGLLVYSTHE